MSETGLIFQLGDLVEPIVPLVIESYDPPTRMLRLVPDKFHTEMIILGDRIVKHCILFPIKSSISSYEDPPFYWASRDSNWLRNNYPAYMLPNSSKYEPYVPPNFQKDGIQHIVRKSNRLAVATFEGYKDYKDPSLIPKCIGKTVTRKQLRGYFVAMAKGNFESPSKQDYFKAPINLSDNENIYLKLFTQHDNLYYFLNINLCERVSS